MVENNLGFSRLGVVVGRRELPLAVHRNRLKRIARTCFRDLPVIDGWDVVVRLKTRLGQEHLLAAEMELRSLFTRWGHQQNAFARSEGGLPSVNG
jgi:ribonuclease P protein component